MLTYTIRRLISLAISLVLISLLIFTVMRIIPGDPAQMMLGTEAEPETLEILRDKLGLDEPLIVQYLSWARGVLTGNLGDSLRYNVPISALISSRLLVTAPLAGIAILLSILLGVPTGLYAGTHRNQMGDYGVMIFSQIGLAVPAFWFGILLMLIFAVQLHWFPAGGFIPWTRSVSGAFKSLVLPAIALGIIRAAVIARLSRSALLEVLHQDYIRTARSKGLVEHIILYKHALRNALIPIITIVAMQFAALLAGTIIIENVFYLPGLGRLAFQAISQRDLPVVQDIVLLIAVMVVGMNLLVDLTYVLLDPRIRLE